MYLLFTGCYLKMCLSQEFKNNVTLTALDCFCLPVKMKRKSCYQKTLLKMLFKNFSGIFLIKELNIFSLMVMYQNDLIIFSSDNYKCNSTCHFHMFIYFYVSIFISLTNIYPLQGQEVRDQPGLVNQPSGPSSSSLTPSQPTISTPNLPSQAPTSDVAAIDSSVEQPSMPSFKCVESL